ncbi:uncharacterized protein K452DRAFT_307665 [Aplosporella prunicola CBS 121167]|uniref:Homeobox domain-containing protein n=1 Tax=Aplosporella prunicola CBS 121167 TaxID=1176127 RepID=A0A6A6BEY8_9PEZI|nr:uncharacterized protein K452DRAFT_307665 [Aplosporella prunicola CBS 121167]KAF2142732.1 hypothetical protein K452DRAFT_307665 [Aplosporella prunicola CBS 121167]
MALWRFSLLSLSAFWMMSPTYIEVHMHYHHNNNYHRRKVTSHTTFTSNVSSFSSPRDSRRNKGVLRALCHSGASAKGGQKTRPCEGAKVLEASYTSSEYGTEVAASNALNLTHQPSTALYLTPFSRLTNFTFYPVRYVTNKFSQPYKWTAARECTLLVHLIGLGDPISAAEFDKLALLLDITSDVVRARVDFFRGQQTVKIRDASPSPSPAAAGPSNADSVAGSPAPADGSSNQGEGEVEDTPEGSVAPEEGVSESRARTSTVRLAGSVAVTVDDSLVESDAPAVPERREWSSSPEVGSDVVESIETDDPPIVSLRSPSSSPLSSLSSTPTSTTRSPPVAEVAEDDPDDDANDDADVDTDSATSQATPSPTRHVHWTKQFPVRRYKLRPWEEGMLYDNSDSDSNSSSSSLGKRSRADDDEKDDEDEEGEWNRHARRKRCRSRTATPMPSTAGHAWRTKPTARMSPSRITTFMKRTTYPWPAQAAGEYMVQKDWLEDNSEVKYWLRHPTTSPSSSSTSASTSSLSSPPSSSGSSSPSSSSGSSSSGSSSSGSSSSGSSSSGSSSSGFSSPGSSSPSPSPPQSPSAAVTALDRENTPFDLGFMFHNEADPLGRFATPDFLSPGSPATTSAPASEIAVDPALLTMFASPDPPLAATTGVSSSTSSTPPDRV